jgi:hypothetical protein
MERRLLRDGVSDGLRTNHKRGELPSLSLLARIRMFLSILSLPQSDDFVTITTRISPPSIASAIDFLFFP